MSNPMVAQSAKSGSTMGLGQEEDVGAEGVDGQTPGRCFGILILLT